MKKQWPFLFLFAASAILLIAAAQPRDESGIIHYRSGARLTFDDQVMLAHEDGLWSIQSSNLAQLAKVAGGNSSVFTNLGTSGGLTNNSSVPWTNTTSIVTSNLTLNGKINGIKVYRGLLTQSGTDAPVATVLENTLGGTPVWSYSDVGRYVVTLAGAFTSAKTLTFCQGTGNISIPVFYPASADTCELQTKKFSAGAFSYADGEVFDTSFQILVYP